jgi:hypothetical protein
MFIKIDYLGVIFKMGKGLIVILQQLYKEIELRVMSVLK